MSYARTSTLAVSYGGNSAQVNRQLLTISEVGVLVRPNLALGLAAEFSGQEVDAYYGPVRGHKLGGLVRYYQRLTPKLALAATVGGGHLRQESFGRIFGPNNMTLGLVSGTGYYLDFTP